MIQLYREREELFTGNSGNSGNLGARGTSPKGLFQRVFWGIWSRKGPWSRGRGAAGKGLEKAPNLSLSLGFGSGFPTFPSGKGSWLGFGGSLPNPGFSGIIIPLPKEKSPFPSFFPPLFQLFSCSFPPPVPSGMSSRVSEFPARGPPEIPGVWNRLLPNKTHQKHSQTGKEFQEKQRKANRKGGFCWKSFPGPIRLREFLGSARQVPEQGQGIPNPPKSNIPGEIPAEFGILPAWIPIPAGSGIIPIPIPFPIPFPSFPQTPGRARGCFMYTAPIPGSEPIPRGDPGILGMLQFPGTLSCPQG